MDKGSNISFPLDSGSTVYNGSGISVGGKASTDILHAAGGTTKIKTLKGSIPQDEMDTEANAITISAYGASLVAVNSRRGSSIVHEAEHIKNHIWQYIGYTPQRDNDEVDAYLLTYIYDKITQVFYKHKDNKE